MPGDEQELIRRFQEGQPEAFDEIMKLFQERALSVAFYRTGNREDALDIVQEAFIRMYKLLPKWKPKASLFTWLYKVILNLSVDRIRALNKAGEVALEDFPEPSDGKKRHNPRMVLEGKETVNLIEEAVAQLPPKQRDVFILRQFHNLKLKEIARIQRCSVGAVKANLFQALQKLRDNLRGYY